MAAEMAGPLVASSAVYWVACWADLTAVNSVELLATRWAVPMVVLRAARMVGLWEWPLGAALAEPLELRRAGKSADSWVVEKAVPMVAHWERLSAASSAEKTAGSKAETLVLT